MIQRIQSVWLLLAFVAGLLMFFLPLSEISASGSEFILKYRGVYKISGQDFVLKKLCLGLAAISFLTMLLSIVNIFLFKKRTLQMRICVFTMLLVVAIFGLSIFMTYFTFGKEEVTVATGSILPFLILIFTFLARKKIKKDDELVKSTDRIR